MPSPPISNRDVASRPILGAFTTSMRGRHDRCTYAALQRNSVKGSLLHVEQHPELPHLELTHRVELRAEARSQPWLATDVAAALVRYGSAATPGAGRPRHNGHLN